MTNLDRLRVLCLPTGPDEYAIAMARAVSTVASVTLPMPRTMFERFGDDLPRSVGTHPSRWPRHRDPRNLLFLGRLLRLVHETRPDVLHFLGDSVFWLAMALPLLRRYPKVVTVHDVDFHPGDTQSRTVPAATIALLRRSADALIVHGGGLRAALLASGIGSPGRVHVVDHPVLDRHLRIAARARLVRTTAVGPRILFFGRVMAYKGLDLLIEASDHVIRHLPEARFVVAGTGPDLARLRSDLDRRPWFEVRDRYVSDAETAQLFLDADLLALPYIEASQSGVLAQAAGFGLPVVATDVGELGPLVRRTGMGLVVPQDALGVARGIVQLLFDPPSRSRCAAAASRAGQGMLSSATIAAETLGIYRQAIRQRSEPRYLPAPVARKL